MNEFFLSVVENAFEADTVRRAAEEWPQATWSGWHAQYQEGYHRKKACNYWEKMSSVYRTLLTEMLFFDVSRLGLGDLVPDTALWGGGMHGMGKDSVLGLHLDASHHAQSGMRRRLNGILFLNPEWKPEWGGSLELWDEGKTRPTVTIAPVFNRFVLFATSDTSWHGIPQQLRCPEDVMRMTLAVWWYERVTGAVSRQRAHFLEAA